MLNKALLIGYLGDAPQIRKSRAGVKYAVLQLATNEPFKDADGNRGQDTEWHRVVIYNDGLVGIAEKYLKKGSKVYIEGAIKTRRWTDDNDVERFTTEIVLRAFRSGITLLDRKQGVRDADGEDDYGADSREN